jgi:hypothetical protein
VSPFIVVVVVGACAWVVARAATQPVEPATAGPDAGRADEHRARRRRHGAPPGHPRPAAPDAFVGVGELAGGPPTAVVEAIGTGAVLAPPGTGSDDAFAPDVDLLPLPEAGRLVEPGVVVSDVVVGEVDEDVDDLDVVDRGRPLGVRSDPGEPALPMPVVERARSAAILVGIAVGLGLVVAASVGVLFFVAFVLLRSAFG